MKANRLLLITITIVILTGCQEKQWTTNPEAYKTPDTHNVKSVETATVGVIVETPGE